MFNEMKAGKECATLPEEGRRGAQMGYRKKTHSLERTHVLDSKVTLTHHERNDAGREREGEVRKGVREGEQHVFRGKSCSCFI